MQLVQITPRETINLDNCLGWSWEPDVNSGRFRFVGTSGGTITVRFSDLIPSRCSDTFRLGRGLITHESGQPYVYREEMDEIASKVLDAMNRWLVMGVFPPPEHYPKTDSPSSSSLTLHLPLVTAPIFNFGAVFAEVFLEWSDSVGIPRETFQ